MKPTINLQYLTDINEQNFKELWDNVFSGDENSNYINKYIPSKVNNKDTLFYFLTRKGTYDVWLIKRKTEQDIIGFVIHGDFWPSQRNNIGLNIGLKYKGKGYGNEALESLIHYLKRKGLKETYALCVEENKAITKVLENNNFINEGRTGTTHNNFHELKYKLII